MPVATSNAGHFCDAVPSMLKPPGEAMHAQGYNVRLMRSPFV
jgi:hypothetical protein